MKTLETFFDNFSLLADAPNGVAKLRGLILQLAFEGKLVSQNSYDEPASILLKKISKDKIIVHSTNGKRNKKKESLPAIEDDETAFTLPDGWQWSRFVDVATIASNLVHPKDYLDYPHVAPDNIEKFTGKLLPHRSVREDKISSSNHKFFDGQIVYSKIRPNLAKAVIVDFEGLCSADMYPINSHIYTQFLLKYMLSEIFLNMAVKTDTRVAMPKINQDELNKVLVPVPPLEEQKRIVAKVDELMRLCDELETRKQARRESRVRLNNATLAPLHNAASLAPEEFEQASVRLADNFDALYDSAATVGKLRSTILQLAVQGKLVPQDPHDEPASALLEGIRKDKDRLIKEKKIRQDSPVAPLTKDDCLFAVPDRWEWTKLDSLCYLITDGTHYTPTYTPSGVPFLSVKDVTGGKIDFRHTRFISPKEHDALSKRCKPEFENVLFTKVGTTGIAKVIGLPHLNF